MINNVDFIQEHYQDQIKAYNAFIKDAYPYLPGKNNSLVRFGGGTALAIYYFQHRLSFDIDLFATDIQILNYLSPKHWIEETNLFNSSSYIDLSNHIRVLHKENNIKIDVLVAQEASKDYLVDDSKKIFNTTIYVESIEDIIAKKIVYRRNDNLTRDIIDIAISIKYADNVLQKLYNLEKINKNDVQELYNSLLELDLNTFQEEVEIIQPFEKYLDDASNAPEIIKIVCSEILLKAK